MCDAAAAAGGFLKAKWRATDSSQLVQETVAPSFETLGLLVSWHSLEEGISSLPVRQATPPSLPQGPETTIFMVLVLILPLHGLMTHLRVE